MPPPRTRPRPAQPTLGIPTGTFAPPRIQFAPTDVQTVVNSAEDAVAKKLGVTAAALPADVKSAIQASAVQTLSARAATIVQRDVESAVKASILKGVKPLDVLGDRMKAARDGLAVVKNDPNVDAMIKDSAHLLFKKYEALKTAGFDAAQAFQLVIAEVQSRNARR